MAIDNETVKRVASLAHLKIEDNKLEATKEEFNKILDFIEQLNEVDTSNVEPMFCVNGGEVPMREDEVTDGNLKEEILKNAPMLEFGYFAVPKVVE